ncbi:MAG: DUF421 domain-containing protein [Bacillota bacterium]|jgi:uncharacterized membrane protein YcaP (DUF421 family)
MSWWEILARSVLLFFLSLFFLRFMGKRNLSRMTPFHFTNYLVIGAVISLMITGIITNLVFGLIALAVWVILPVTLEFLALKSKWVHDLIKGKETVLIKQGKIMEENLFQVRLTGEELLGALRAKDAFHVTDVEFALLEPTGDISVLLKSDKKPVTSDDLGKEVAPQNESQTVILDGNILIEPLATMGLNQDWLLTELDKAGVSVKNVFVGQVDSLGNLYLDLFDDSIQAPQSKVKELTYANLEKCHADLMTYALETKDQGAKKMYAKNAEKLKHLVKKLEPYL